MPTDCSTSDLLHLIHLPQLFYSQPYAPSNRIFNEHLPQQSPRFVFSVFIFKKGTKYTNGLVFPGGHIEQGESFRDSVIREIKEETGLDIFEPQPCGFKDWIQDDGTRYIVLLYKTNKFSGTLRSSEEGHVFWLDRKDLDEANFIWDMRELMEIFETDQYSEFFFEYKIVSTFSISSYNFSNCRYILIL